MKTKVRTKEEQFFNALKDVFIGEKVEGESGYINLMKIKSKYYQNKVFPRLKKDIEDALKDFPDFREELFDKLYTFFERYFSESGSIYFAQTRYPQSVYERIYTDNKDVILFWKTHMLYYVKTDRLFKDLDVEIDGYKFYFDVSSLEHKKANEKRKIIYEFKEKREDGALVFEVLYSERGRETDIEKILRELKKQGVRITEDILERAFRVFERQSEVDYFINKNVRKFLKEQFDLSMYQYIFSGESVWTEKRIKQLQVLKDIAYKIIDFIGQFEDELVKIWNKPKFVLNSNYVITLDRIAKKEEKGGIEVIEKIINHPKFEEQVKEWKELKIVDDSFNKDEIILRDLTGKTLNPKYQFLPIDTKYFKDLELEILSLFDDLDNELDGWLIKSENYQALNTILPKFRGKVQTIYIDPPYNTGSDEFIYEDKFRHSTWLTMMENRLSLAKEFMSKNSSFVSHIDDNEVEKFIFIVDTIFTSEDYERFNVSVIGNPRGRRGEKIAKTHEYLIFKLTKNLQVGLKSLDTDKEKPFLKTGKESERETGKNCFYPIYIDPNTNEIVGFGDVPSDDYHPKSSVIEKEGIIEIWPITEDGKERKWRYSRDTVENIKDNLYVKDIRRKANAIYLKKEEENFKSVWNESYHNIAEYGTNLLKHLSLPYEFIYPKSVYTAIDVLKITSKEKSSIILDFFAGSGTTAHAVMKLNKEDGGKRKFILVEMADYFYKVIIPRIKKVAYSFNWKDGKPQDNDGIGIFCKYYELEQYEDTLRRVKYEDTDLFDNPYKDPYNQYIFMKDEKLLSALEIHYENDKVKVDLSKLYDNIDIAETLSNLLGKWIKKITADKVIFEDGEEIDLNNLDYKLIKPLIWW